MPDVFKKLLTGTPVFQLDSGLRPAVPGGDWSIRKYTLRGGLQEGIEVVEVDNGCLAFTILPTRGMGIWRGRFREIALGWDSPVRDPVHPAFVDLNDRGGLGWLKGFNEWIVRCGLDSNGAPGEDLVLDNNGNESRVFLPLHGKIANTPAHRVTIEADDDGTLSVSGTVDETMMFGPALQLTTTISTKVGSNELHIHDRVTNLNRTATEFELLYHCNFGSPLLEEGSRVVAPIKSVAPRDPRAQEGIDTFDTCLKPTTGYVEQVYWCELAAKSSGETCVLLKNRNGTAGASLRFNLNELPAFTIWKNTAARETGYVIGLEPGTDYPNAKRFEREKGRLVRLRGRASYDIHLTAAIHDTQASVRTLEEEIKRIQGRPKPVVHPEPQPRLSDLGG